jgi:hypothetical protein
MYSEAIFHSSVGPNIDDANVVDSLQMMKKKMDQLHVSGCTVIHEGEMVHLFQGTLVNIILMRDFMKKNGKVFSTTELTLEEINSVEFHNWDLYSTSTDFLYTGLKDSSISKLEFVRRYMNIKSRAFTQYHRAVESVLKRRLFLVNSAVLG